MGDCYRFPGPGLGNKVLLPYDPLEPNEGTYQIDQEAICFCIYIYIYIYIWVGVSTSSIPLGSIYKYTIITAKTFSNH